MKLQAEAEHEARLAAERLGLPFLVYRDGEGRQRIHPLRPGKTLRRRQFEAVWDDLVVLMREGVRTGRIDTVRPEHTPEAMGRPPRQDDHGGEVYVYRRTGQPCLVCERKVATAVLEGRNLFWCGHCQRRYRPRALQ